MTMRVTATAFLLSLAIILASCSGDNGHGRGDEGDVDSTTIAALIDASLHNTTAGMEYFYAEANGGFEKFTGIPYEQLECKNCHVTGEDCRRCHPDDGEGGFAQPQPDNCLKGCHGRQMAEAAVNPDVHMTEHGLICADCHTASDVHGDGVVYMSMLAGAIEAACDQEGCHTNADSVHADNKIYKQHADEFHCAACHTKNTVSCVNCHFESEVKGLGKIANTQVHDWKFLLKYKRPDDSLAKVYPGNIQTLTYDDSAFYVIAPFYGHAITAPESCEDCHSAPAVTAYNETGSIPLLTWDKDTKTMNHMSGVIPVMEDWATAFKVDFITRENDTGQWIFQQAGPSMGGTQMLFAEPLSAMPGM